MSLNGAGQLGTEIIGRQWLPEGEWGARAGPAEPMGQYTKDEYWRYLGMVQNGEGEGDISGMF
jgi:hypothetical protein